MSAVPFPPVGEYALTSPVQTAVRSAGRLVGELHPVSEQEIKSRDALVAECAHNLAVAEAVIAPVHQVLEHAIRRIFDAVFFLKAGAAAEGDIAAAFDPMPADVVVLLDDDDGRARFRGGDRSGQPGGSRADNDNVGGEIPVAVQFCCVCLRR
jgi:hypothetical protein